MRVRPVRGQQAKIRFPDREPRCAWGVVFDVGGEALGLAVRVAAEAAGAAGQGDAGVVAHVTVVMGARDRQVPMNIGDPTGPSHGSHLRQDMIN